MCSVVFLWRKPRKRLLRRLTQPVKPLKRPLGLLPARVSGSLREVIQRHCHRCQSLLHTEDEGSLFFCWNCGAPQVTLSEELLEQAEQQIQNATASEQTASAPPIADPSAANWKAIIVIAMMVAGAISAISIVLPPFELLAWLAPSVVLAIYASRHRQTRITGGLGARIGLICGILTSLGMAVITTTQMLILRYGLHRMAEFEANVNSIMLEAKARAIEQSGQASAGFFDLILTVPEFRAGFILMSLAAVVAMLLVLSTAGGAFAGFVRSRQTKSLS
jgi:predicted RNA-binding Zn-ribbon protein involved in translation (DUF1610 family)